MNPEPQLPALTEEQLGVLRCFASFEAGIDEVSRLLAGVFEINTEPAGEDATGDSPRVEVTCNFSIPEPGIAITRGHIAKALEQKRLGLVSERDLVRWATVILLNDAYVLDPGDEDLIAEWLNNISMHLDAS